MAMKRQLTYLRKEQIIQGHSTREHYERYRNSDGEYKTQFDPIRDGVLFKMVDNITTNLSITECNIGEEPDLKLNFQLVTSDVWRYQKQNLFLHFNGQT